MTPFPFTYFTPPIWGMWPFNQAAYVPNLITLTALTYCNNYATLALLARRP